MSVSLDSEYVAPERLNLEECQYCGRRFFSQPLQKHVVACEREWMRGNFTGDKKPADTPCPLIKEHITGYNIKVKTFADMLALGAERRKRWRKRHEEFIHTIKAAKANMLKERGEIADVVEPLRSEAAQAGLTQCEFCGRRFNDAAYMKHKDQCKVKQTSSPPEQTEEQKEAKLRFLKRMKYNLKLADKMKLDEKGTSEFLESNPTGSISPTYSPLESNLIIKETPECRQGLEASQTLSSELLSADVFNKFIQNNLTSLLANAPLQISNCNHVSVTDSSTSLPFFSASSLDSTSAAPSAVIVTEKSSALLKHKRELEQHQNKITQLLSNTDESGERADAASVQDKHSSSTNTGSAVSANVQRAGSCRSMKPPPTVVNNFMNDMNVESTSRRGRKSKEERDTDNDEENSRGKCEKPEVMVLMESSDLSYNPVQSRNHKHGLKRKESRKISESEQASRVVFYKFNSISTEASQEQKTSQKKYPLHLRIPHQTNDESGAVATVVIREGGITSQPSRATTEEAQVMGLPSYRRTLSKRNVGHNDVSHDFQSISHRSHHKSSHGHHRHKVPPDSMSTPRSRGSSHSHHSRGHCGSEDSGRTSSNSRYCPQCGKKFPSKARFCSSCGAIRKSKVTTTDSTSISVSQRLLNSTPTKDVSCD